MKLLTIRSGYFRILATCSERERCPLLDFLSELEGKLVREGDRMLNLLERVSQEGPPRRTEVSHQLKGEIYQFVQGRIRVLYFYDRDRIIVCTHGFMKSSQKTPKREIEKAEELRARYFKAKAKDSFVIFK